MRLPGWNMVEGLEDEIAWLEHGGRIRGLEDEFAWLEHGGRIRR